MKFEHQVTIPASRDAINAVLHDVPRAARCMPGVEETNAEADGTYTGSLRIKVGPMGFTLSGKMSVEEKLEDGLWRLITEAQDRRLGGGIHANVEAILTETSPSSTDMKMSADIQFIGRLGELGQPLIKRRAESMFKDFAENLRKEVS
jgi:carbon monoxide dehydrogenase subunit G